MKTSKKTAKKWMKDQVRERWSVDPNTGEVNTTELAEAACNEFELFGPAPDFDAPEWLFEVAFEVAEWWEKGQSTAAAPYSPN